MKALLVALYQRVFLHYRPTLIGIGLAALVLVLEQTTLILQGMTDGWAKALAAALVLIGGWVRDWAKPKIPPVPQV